MNSEAAYVYSTRARGQNHSKILAEDMARITALTTGSMITLDPNIPPINQHVSFQAEGSTRNLGAFKRAVWPNFSNSRAQWCAPEQASMTRDTAVVSQSFPVVCRAQHWGELTRVYPSRLHHRRQKRSLPD